MSNVQTKEMWMIVRDAVLAEREACARLVEEEIKSLRRHAHYYGKSVDAKDLADRETVYHVLAGMIRRRK